MSCQLVRTRCTAAASPEKPSSLGLLSWVPDRSPTYCGPRGPGHPVSPTTSSLQGLGGLRATPRETQGRAGGSPPQALSQGHQPRGPLPLGPGGCWTLCPTHALQEKNPPQAPERWGAESTEGRIGDAGSSHAREGAPRHPAHSRCRVDPAESRPPCGAAARSPPGGSGPHPGDGTAGASVRGEDGPESQWRLLHVLPRDAGPTSSPVHTHTHATRRYTHPHLAF